MRIQPWQPISFPSVAQKQSARLITGGPGCITPQRDQMIRWMAQTDERRTEAPNRSVRSRPQRPFFYSSVAQQQSAGLITRESRGASPRGGTTFLRH